MTAKHALAAALWLSASALATANPTSLTTTLASPAELQLGEPDLYRVKVRNPSVFPAQNVVVRLTYAAGMSFVQPQPPNCSVVIAPMLPGGPSTRHARCILPTLPPLTTWVWDFILRAPLPSNGPSSFTHQAVVTSSNVPATSLSLPVTTTYQNFTLPVVPGSHWEGESCTRGTGTPDSEGSVPVPWGICTKPASQNLQGSFLMLANGVVDATESPQLGTGTTARWQQNSLSTVVRYVEQGGPGLDYSEASAMLKIINSRCFRGPGQTLPYPGNPVFYSGFKICQIP